MQDLVLSEKERFEAVMEIVREKSFPNARRE